VTEHLPNRGPEPRSRGAGVAARREHTDESTRLDRRFEAVVVWSTTVEAVVRAASSLQDLGRAGALVGVVAPLAVDELASLLAWPTVDAADLVLADSGGSGAAVIDETGGHPVAVAARPEHAASDTLEELWRLGVDPGEILLLMDGWPGPAYRPASELVLDGRHPTVLVVNAGRTAPPADVVFLAGGSARLRRVLADQLRRRRRGALPEAPVRAGWSFVVNGFDVRRERVDEARLTLADGHIGTAGAPVTPDANQYPWVIAAGVYDGDGADTHLLTAPRVFSLAGMDGVTPQRRVLDLRAGVLYESDAVASDVLESVRFASLAQPTTSVMRVHGPPSLRAGAPVAPPVDDPVHDRGRSGDASWIRVAASTGGIVAAAVQTRTRHGGGATLDRLAVYRADPAALPEPSPAVDALDGARRAGFDRLLARHRRAWARRWDHADVVVEGDDDLQLAIRFALFHLMASASDRGESALGARGLTGTGYRGHVFWDADTFVLPFLAATHPRAARAVLEYRLRRLPAALEAARASGRAGARFPWESARSGFDVTPTSARDRAGRIIPILTGELEEHIVADVSWAASCYVDWSGDESFARGPGRRILIETARYWASRIHLDPDGSAHIDGVIGPDEYHERVDDNAYTNVMARWNLRRAAGTEVGDGGADDAGVDERERWVALADALVDGYDPATRVYEQFAGFGRLEPLIIADIAPRRPIAADVLLGAERVAGSQVIKQADVLMLHHLVPDEVEPGSLEPNLRFYEPRTAHGSSLSPATHALLLARARDFDRALDALRIAARMDLDDLTGSSAGGLHLATMGGLWQALAYGFVGLRPHAGILHVDPALPPAWPALEMRVRFHGASVHVRAEHSRLSIATDAHTAIVVGATPFDVGPGRCVFRRRGAHWEEAT
jgi:trehalose/maltose hydrolase-like predicted phosphorylase